MNFAISKFNYP